MGASAPAHAVTRCHAVRREARRSARDSNNHCVLAPVLARRSVIVFGTTAAVLAPPACLDGWEAHCVVALSTFPYPVVIAAGNGTRGAIYAAYAFSEAVLGVNPWYIINDDPPLYAGPSLAIADNFTLFVPSPYFTYRGILTNDEDLLGHFRASPTGTAVFGAATAAAAAVMCRLGPTRVRQSDVECVGGTTHHRTDDHPRTARLLPVRRAHVGRPVPNGPAAEAQHVDRGHRALPRRAERVPRVAARTRRRAPPLQPPRCALHCCVGPASTCVALMLPAHTVLHNTTQYCGAVVAALATPSRASRQCDRP